MNLFTIPPHVPFLDAVAGEWMHRSEGDPLAVARGLVLLPTRRAARALAEAFLRLADGRPMLLPRIAALGSLDEAPLALGGAPRSASPRSSGPALGRAEPNESWAMNGAGGAPRTADRAWRLAAELASLIDGAELAGIDLSTRLPEAAEADFAAHWKQTLDFLQIVDQDLAGLAVRARPDESRGKTGRAARSPGPRLGTGPPGRAGAGRRGNGRHSRRCATAQGRCARCRTAKWSFRDWISTSTTRPGMPWTRGTRRRGCTGCWETGRDAAGRSALALSDRRRDPRACPKAGSPCCGRRSARNGAQGLAGAPAIRAARLRSLDTADQQEEAAAIALVLREALEVPGARAALVTPDRELAGRVSAELLRYGVVADDSAGEPVAQTPPAVFLRLLVRAVAEDLAPVPLLSLLKHPLAAAGLAPAACRAAARELELLCLRGPRPSRGLSGLRRALDRSRREANRHSAADLLSRLEHCLEPTLRLAASVVVAPSEALSALIEAAERLATTDELAGPARLWAAEEGEALATQLAAVMDAALPYFPTSPPAAFPGLLDAVLEGVVVRSRRAVRGRGGTNIRACLFGACWKHASRRRTWSSRRADGNGVAACRAIRGHGSAGHARPHRPALARAERIGQAAHDFVSAACAAPQVVLSCPRRRDGAPAVPARWLERLRAFLAGQGMTASAPGGDVGPRHRPARGGTAARIAAAAASSGRVTATPA